MGRKDTLEKGFISDNDIFADVVNATVFHGKQVVHPKDLQEQDSTEVYSEMISGKLLSIQKYRDVLKYVTIRTAGNCCYAIIGVENQTSVNRIMVVRNMVYDSINYMEQASAVSRRHCEEDKANGIRNSIEGLREGDTLIPVITIVIYFGKGKWNAPKSLHELFPKDTPEEIKRLAADYKITVLAPKEIDDPEIFHTEDMQAVVRALADADDVEKVNSLVREDPLFSRIGRKAAMIIRETTPVKIQIPKNCEEVNMNEAVKAYEDKIRAEGRDEGKVEGKTEYIAKLKLLSKRMQSEGADMSGYIEATTNESVFRKMCQKYNIS